jgi:prepilin-type N-terminal cleavage/methylation domain-containing protein
MKKEKAASEKGFTIAELLTVVIIIGILSAVVFSNYGGSNKTMALGRASQQLAQDLRRAQQMSMGSLSGVAGVTAGYGMYFINASSGSPSSLSYIIFRNDTKASLNASYVNSSSDPTVETINIEKGIKICDIKVNGTTLGSNPLSVFFLPPDPITYINGGYVGSTASIVLCVADDASKTMTVKINNSGMIDITNP